MNQFPAFKASRDASALAAKAVRFVLQGKYPTVAEAFAHDKKMLQEAASKHGASLSQSSGVMAGKLRRR